MIFTLRFLKSGLMRAPTTRPSTRGFFEGSTGGAAGDGVGLHARLVQGRQQHAHRARGRHHRQLAGAAADPDHADAADVTEILRVDEKAFTPVYTCTVFEACGPVRFARDNQRLYMITNKGDTDLTRLVLFDPMTMAEEAVESDPMNRVDFGNALFSDVMHHDDVRMVQR